MSDFWTRSTGGEPRNPIPNLRYTARSLRWTRNSEREPRIESSEPAGQSSELRCQSCEIMVQSSKNNSESARDWSQSSEPNSSRPNLNSSPPEPNSSPPNPNASPPNPGPMPPAIWVHLDGSRLQGSEPRGRTFGAVRCPDSGLARVRRSPRAMRLKQESCHADVTASVRKLDASIVGVTRRSIGRRTG